MPSSIRWNYGFVAGELHILEKALETPPDDGVEPVDAADQQSKDTPEVIEPAPVGGFVGHDEVEQPPAHAGGNQDPRTDNADQPRCGDLFRCPDAFLDLPPAAGLQPGQHVEDGQRQQTGNSDDGPDQSAGLKQAAQTVGLIDDREIVLGGPDGVHRLHFEPVAEAVKGDGPHPLQERPLPPAF